MKTDDAVSQPLASRMPAIASAITTTTTTTRDGHHLPIAMASTSQSQPQSKWNTDRLAWRLGADATSAACAGALIAPIITIIDR
ncbi:hypothetical protein THARTR1_04291 [Trichoderma harzianum]|uniref:Uncharacterized protein n=1 Tax=Trichoderma harzianum TaxID=5544 RepID=A0A2K0UCF8_TRIHA|nr:hypothetical protein THARTR1_04291 [Trichoderma harzianum]